MDLERRDALARDINLEDITSSRRNAEVLRQLRHNIIWDYDNRSTLYIDEEDDNFNYDFDDTFFIIREGDDLSWLGYFIGRNQSLYDLAMKLPEQREQIGAFIEGVSYNRSLSVFSLRGFGTNLGLQNLSSFFRENDNLTVIKLCGCEIGRECARELALALSQRQVKSLRSLLFRDNNLGDEGFVDIIQALVTQPELDFLQCSDNNIGRISCKALGALLRERNSNLTSLFVLGNDIDDVGLQELVPGLCSNNNLRNLSISDPITAVGLRSLSPFLQSDSCRLDYLCVEMRLGDEEATALTDALKGNKSLTMLLLPHHDHENQRRNMTDAGWSAFSKLLCDTSSINNTYLSNHTLMDIHFCADSRPFITDLLQMNAAAQKEDTMRNQKIAMQSLTRCKIFMSHPDLDMKPLFEYKLKLLPWVMGWFRKSKQLCGEEVGDSIKWYQESVPALRRRELSAVYKFVHGMPLLISDGYWTTVLNESQTKKHKLQKQRLEAEKRKLPLMLQKVEKGIKKAEEIERSASKRLRR